MSLPDSEHLPPGRIRIGAEVALYGSDDFDVHWHRVTAVEPRRHDGRIIGYAVYLAADPKPLIVNARRKLEVRQ